VLDTFHLPKFIKGLKILQTAKEKGLPQGRPLPKDEKYGLDRVQKGG